MQSVIFQPSYILRDFVRRLQVVHFQSKLLHTGRGDRGDPSGRSKNFCRKTGCCKNM